MDIQHVGRGRYCVACGSLCRAHGRSGIGRAPNPPKGSDFDAADMGLLRSHFERWKAEHLPLGHALADTPVFRDALTSLISDHGYSLLDVGLMLGVTRERVRQWAKRIGIPERGANYRAWDEAAQRFVTVGDGYKWEYERQAKRARTKKQRGTTWGDFAAKRRRVAVWVLRDLREFGDNPCLVDLVEAFGKVPSATVTPTFVGGLGIGLYRNRPPWNGVRTGLDALWAEAGFAERPKYARYHHHPGATGRHDTRHLTPTPGGR